MNGIHIFQSFLIIAGLLSVSVGLSYIKAALKRYSQALSNARSYDYV